MRAIDTVHPCRSWLFAFAVERLRVAYDLLYRAWCCWYEDKASCSVILREILPYSGGGVPASAAHPRTPDISLVPTVPPAEPEGS